MSDVDSGIVLKVLKELEWRGPFLGDKETPVYITCPICKVKRGSIDPYIHEDGCEMKAAIDEVKKWNT